MLGQWSLEMNHVAAIVGGYNSQQKHIGQTGVRFKLIPRPRQEAAVKFLNDNAFKAPAWALNEDVLRRIEPVGVLDRIEASQTRVLNSLLSSARVLRLVEQEALDGAAAYAPLDFLGDVRTGVWSEIYAPASTRIDAYRRNLQRAYVETLGNRVNGAQAQSDDARAFFRGELKTLDGDLTAAAGAADRPRHAAAHRGRAHADCPRARSHGADAGPARRDRAPSWPTSRSSTSAARRTSAGRITWWCRGRRDSAGPRVRGLAGSRVRSPGV